MTSMDHLKDVFDEKTALIAGLEKEARMLDTVLRKIEPYNFIYVPTPGAKKADILVFRVEEEFCYAYRLSAYVDPIAVLKHSNPEQMPQWAGRGSKFTVEVPLVHPETGQFALWQEGFFRMINIGERMQEVQVTLRSLKYKKAHPTLTTTDAVKSNFKKNYQQRRNRR